jgi:DNA-binding NtrC family response regulator
MAAHKIVILDNNQQRRDALKSMVAEWGHTPFIFEKESRCLDNLGPLDADLVISGSLSVDKARRFINTLQLTNCGVPLVIISDDRDIMEFVDTNGFGDVCVLNVNSDPAEIESTVNRVLKDDVRSKINQGYCPLIIGSGPEIVKIKKMIADIDRVNEAVLIQGEPGTGKELMARFIHLKSKRYDGPFVKLSMPQLPADFFETQLLMLEDPQTRQKGIFAAAQQGTLLLEEIAEMPLEPQATLLKMIDEAGIFKPADDAFDVRIIATSSRDLAALVDYGKFRKDLFYRLNVIRLDVPPLRYRLEDITALVDFFTDKFCIETGRSHFQLSEKMKSLFACYHWPGNIQELEDLIKRIVVDGAGDTVAKKLRIHKKYSAITDSYKDIGTLAGLNDVKKHVKDLDNISLKKIGGIFMERAEKKLVKKALESTNWNRKRAAALLDISYKSLLNKIKGYNLSQKQASGIKNQVSGVRHKKPGVRRQASGTRQIEEGRN